MYKIIKNIFILFSILQDNIKNIGCINIENNPICDNNLFIFLLFKFFQVKYSNNCIEIKERKYKNSKNPKILLK
jgi:hypothetical protein